MIADVDPLELARLSPAGLAMYHSRGKWKLSRWLAVLNEALLRVASGECKRLLVMAPPRHGKSEQISKYLPPWYMGVYPDRNVILSSYEARLARSWGRKSRDVLDDVGEEVFGVRVQRGSKAADSWTTTDGGAMNTAGVGGPITGKGAHLLIVDDPVKNAADAHSEVKREATWEWFQSTAYSRLEPDGAIIVLQTRWHEDDLAGRILANQQPDEPWEVLCLPAIAEDDGDPDPLGRLPGEALWPSRYSAERLDQIRRAVGEYWFDALYRQRPSAKGGAILKPEWFEGRRLTFDTDPEDGMPIYVLPSRRIRAATCTHFWTCDTAATTGKGSDFTALGEWAGTKRDELLGLRMEAARLEVPDVLPWLLERYQRAERKPAWIGLEANGTGLAVYQQAKRNKVLADRVRKLEAETDKVTRSLTFAAMAQNGAVYLPANIAKGKVVEGEPWVQPLITEMRQFPRGKHDDRIDVCSYAGIAMRDVLGAAYGLGVAVSARQAKRS